MTFLHPAFLWGLFGLAVPILVHFFYLRRSRKYFFTHTRILEQLLQANRPYIRLSHLILLLIRLVLVVLVVFIFARPALSGVSWASGEVSALLIVDVSPSMHERLPQALALAEEILKKDADVSEVKIISTDRLYGAQRFISKQEALAILREIRPADMGYPLSQILRQMDLSFQGSQFSRKRIYIVSDFQATSVGDVREIPKNDSVEYVLASVPLDLEGNAYIDSVAVVGSEKDRLLRWRLVGPNQKTFSVRIGDQTVLAAPGWHETPWPEGSLYVTLSLSGDSRAFDNGYYVGLLKPSSRTRYVVWRSGTAVSRSLFDRLGRLLGFSLQEREGRLSLWVESLPSEPEWLAKLQEGSTLVVFPPDGLTPKRWAESFLSHRFSMEGEESVKGLSLDLKPEPHYLWDEVFVASTPTGVLPDVFHTERLYRFLPQNGYPVLSTSEEQTLLWEIPWEKGRVFLFTFPLNHSNFSQTSVFVPLFSKIYDLEARKDKVPPAIFLGKETVLSFSRWLSARSLRLRLVGSGLEMVFPVVMLGEGAQVVLGAHPIKAGVYKAFMDEEELGYLGVNIPREESFSPGLSLEAWEKAGLRVRSTQVGLRERGGSGLWRPWHLWVLLAVLFMSFETYWARKTLFPSLRRVQIDS